MYRQIHARISRAIAAGILKPGDRIPSARALTKELGLARGTIDAAYSLLAAEGYVQAQGQAGTVVTPSLRLRPTPAPVVAASPEAISPVETDLHVASPMPFEMGLPALDAFPKVIWRRLGTRYLRSVQAEDLAYPCAQGALPLRTQIAAYLQVSRGIACSPAQVFITSGYQQTLEMTMRALLKAGDRVWLEDPGYPPTRALLRHAQMHTVPVPVDDDGLIVRAGIKAAPRAKAAVVTPAHQSPLCVSLSLPRRLELLDWASKTRSWIIEDDYDGEYRYVSRPLPALKSLDRDGRVIYAGTFSKVLFPGLRLAYVVVPESEIERFRQAGQVFSAGAPTASQAIVTAFIANGHFGRHIQRMRKLYGERRDATAAGLSAVLGRRARIAPQPGGMHLVAHLRSPLQDTVIAKRMRDNGLHAQALTDWSSEVRAGSALLLNFTNVDAQATAESLAKRILKLL
ncbi:GntR family transcriptional regulator/MocR family aminotransferase [Variovorax boronicumulans]|uniref:MocR-like pyridoxine biosynthesis transcription factor PdxR n=1 Tax=Variovorax boronicumulans TaxID=436515 RepID=UPI0027892AE1|nr:PLP-dependent aminotransferase family protein [Variovorax boronicumulans]MDP9912461.1 GntR family transcriptional regulator/MocR family aminotransferase [Variovorax boronicumulans]